MVIKAGPIGAVGGRGKADHSSADRPQLTRFATRDAVARMVALRDPEDRHDGSAASTRTRSSTSRRPMWMSIFSRPTAPLRDAVAGEWRARRGCGAVRLRASTGAPPRCSMRRASPMRITPKLQTFDAKGFGRDIVEFHPAYHAFMAESIGAGMRHDLDERRAARAGAPARGRARGALLHGRAGRERAHVPVTMTRAAVGALAAEPALAGQA